MQEFAASIVETIRHPMVILDLRLNVCLTNRHFCSLVQLTESEVLGQSFAEVMLKQCEVPELGQLLTSQRPSKTNITDHTLFGRFGGARDTVAVLNARQVCDQHGNDAVVIALEGATERRDAEQLLHHSNAALEQRVRERTADLEAANRELEAFCYSVSHDLRAPLRAIDGFSNELIQSYAQVLDHRGRHYLQRIQTGATRMGEVIDALLELSKLTRRTMSYEIVDLTVMAQQVVEDWRVREPHYQPAVRIEPGVIGRGDRRLLRLALENLLGNALKFTRLQPEPEISFGRCGEGSYCVRDNGAGFDMAYVSKLFEAFQRLHTEEEFSGTGIGLATVKRSIERHGGKVWAESELGKGSTFFFTLTPEAAR